MKITTLLVILLLFVAPWAKAQSGPKILRPTSATSGEEMYLSYCADCHGRDGRGLKATATNLTTLAKANKGVFPADRVKETIRGDVDVVAHGPKDMPDWGSLFTYVGSGSKPEVELRVHHLSEYVRSLQVK
jgi:mono/diheme cytochrome c family protein